MIQGLLTLNQESYEAQRWQGSLIYWALVAMGAVINTWGSRLLSFAEGASLIVHVMAFVANFIVMWVCSPVKHSALFVFTLLPEQFWLAKRWDCMVYWYALKLLRSDWLVLRSPV
jgi:hypothetical protein